MPISLKDTANITTANWGTARTLTMGNTGKSVNGSGNVSWSLSEIGAAPAGYGLGTTCQDKSNQDCNNILVTGFYMGHSMTNKPSGCTHGWIYLLVMKHNDSWVRQVAYDFGTASQVYTRVKQNGSWTAWVATDTNTWRGVQDNLTSTATDQSLSANQGKVLKGLIDGKAASNHTHSYVPLANGGNITIHADSDSSSTGEYALIKAGHNELKIASSAGGTTVTKGQDKLTFNGNIVYHAGRKPTISEIGAAPASHTHDDRYIKGNNILLSVESDILNSSALTTSRKQLIAGSADKVYAGNTSANLILESSSTPQVKMNNNFYPIYHTANKPTASEIGAAAASHTHNYAASPSAGGSASTVYLPRVVGASVSANYLPGANKFEFKEFGNDCANTPNASWYHIFTGQGSDAGYNTQLALGMTTEAVYYRNRTVGTWGRWKQLAFTDSSISGNAATATKLQTARTINGTNFDGTGNITTASWGTARNLQIGNTAKSVNGSANVSWSLSEIGAAPTSHNHTSLTGVTSIGFNSEGSDTASIRTTISGASTYLDMYLADDAGQDRFRWRFKPHSSDTSLAVERSLMELYPTSANQKSARLLVDGEVVATSENGLRVVSGNYGFFIRNDGSNTYFMFTNSGDQYGSWNSLRPICINNSNGLVTFGNGLSGSLSGNASTATKLQTARSINGTSFDGSGNITTANWGTARNIQIGNTAKSFNGSGNISWTLGEIGAAPSSSTSLKTTDKTIVGAINEVFQSGNSVKQNLVDTLIAKGAENISTSNSWDSLIDIIEGSNISLAPASFTVEPIPNAQYGFRLLGSGPYYESENRSINSSYAMCKLNIVCNSNYDVYLDCISYGEDNYDYGIISEINTPLSLSYQADTTGVLKSFKGLSSPGVQSVRLSPESGFYYIKYIKDSSQSSGNDSLRFAVRFQKKTGDNPGVPDNPGGEGTILFSPTIGGDNRSLTGGYTHLRQDSDSYLIYDASCIDFCAQSNIMGNTLETVLSENRINLTNYSRLRIKAYVTTSTNDSGGAPLVGFDALGNHDEAFAASTIITSSAQRYYDLDISGLTGNYHLKFNVATSMTNPGTIIKHLYITELILYP